MNHLAQDGVGNRMLVRRCSQSLFLVGIWIFSVSCDNPSTDEVSSQREKDESSNDDNKKNEEEIDEEPGNSEDSCEYPVSCMGDICKETCDDGAICGSTIYPEEREYIENYCYPICNKAYGESECLCDDVCVEIDDETQSAVCLAFGMLSVDELSLPLLDVGVQPGDDDIVDVSDLQVTAYLGDRSIEFRSVYGWFLEGDLFGQGDEYIGQWGTVAMYAPKDSSNAWVLEIYLNERILKQEGVYRSSTENDHVEVNKEQIPDGGVIDDAGIEENEKEGIAQSINWYAQLLSFEDIDGEGSPGRVYSEGKLSDRDENIVEIQKVGSPCPETGTNCVYYKLSFNLEFYEIRAEIQYN